jgi:hypothetical protein
LFVLIQIFVLNFFFPHGSFLSFFQEVVGPAHLFSFLHVLLSSSEHTARFFSLRAHCCRPFGSLLPMRGRIPPQQEKKKTRPVQSGQNFAWAGLAFSVLLQVNSNMI